MKRLPRLALAAALFAGALAGIPSLAFAGNLPAAIDGSVTVMHTNDIHGSYKYSYNASKGAGTVGFDGLAVLYSAQGNAPDLLLDAGDTFHGQSFATMSEGKSIAELMDTFYADGYDATTPGNHDWSYGADKLRTMTGYSTTGTPFAMLCANAKSTSGVWSSSITKTLNRTWEDSEDHSTFDYKIKVGVVGAMDESLGSSLRADLVAGTVVLECRERHQYRGRTAAQGGLRYCCVYRAHARRQDLCHAAPWRRYPYRRPRAHQP